MALRKEQVVSIGTLVVLGFLTYRVLDADKRGPARPKKPEPLRLANHPAPDLALVMPEKRAVQDDARDLYSPPSDTRPLPPLALVPPPIVPLGALRPPPEPGPAPFVWGRLLRVTPEYRDAPDLFADAAAEAGEVAGAATSIPAGAAGASKTATISGEELAARIQSYKKLYDWFRVGDFHFGQIQNPDRFTLARRPNEDVLFVEFNPATGQPKFPGQAASAIPRKTVAEFGFADTIVNQIEIRRSAFGDPLSASEYDPALAFAEWCIGERLVSPRALQVAEEIFGRATKVLPEDPAPRLGLCRTYEASFQFERAFQEYRRLLTGNLQKNPLVLVSLAELEARFRLFLSAEEKLLEAERYGRTSWVVQDALGRFLLARGRPVEAVAHLRLANQHEPSGPDWKRARAGLRVDLGSALIAVGEMAEGAEWFDKALQSDPADARAQAAITAARVLLGKGPAAEIATDVEDALGFDAAFALGLAELQRKTPQGLVRGKALLLAAAAADPLRAYLPWRTLSFVAEMTNHPEEALRFVDLAHENDPTDVWTLYQRGRILAARDDVDGAVESFTAALDREISFVDALAALGELAHRRGDFASAERYFERALSIDPSLTNVQALRGVNHLEQGGVRDAEECFRKVLALDQDHPTARNALAWCYYLKGDSVEALTRLSEVDDNRRTAGDRDPHRLWAKAQIERITDHNQKVAWTDRFERTALLNGWTLQESFGPTVAIHDGIVTLGGSFKANGRVKMWVERNASDFVSLEARITVRQGTTSRVGLFVSRETQRGGESQVEAEVTITRHNEPGKNTLQTRCMKRGEEELAYTDVQGFEWRLDQPMTVRIERTGDASDTRVRILFDGFPVLEDKAMPALGVTRNPLRLGIFAEGQTGRVVQVDVDDVEVVYRERK